MSDDEEKRGRADEDDLDLEDLLGDDPVEEDPAAEPEPERRRKRLERILPEVLKRAIERGLESGLETLTNRGEAIRGAVGDVKLPREIVGYVFSQIDETKNLMVRVVAREVHEFLDATDLAQELQKALTSLSFEIRTEIRFIPNDAGGVKPEVRSQVDPKRARRGGRRRRGAEEELSDEEN